MVMRAMLASERRSPILRQRGIVRCRYLPIETTRMHVLCNRSFSGRGSSEFPPASSTSLGLFEEFVSPHFASLCELPEIKAAYRSDPTPQSIQDLLRSVQIFQTIGGPLHSAVLVLLADAYQQTGQYDFAIRTLTKLPQDELSDVRIRLALSKALCFLGDFHGATLITTELLDSAEIQSSTLARGVTLSLHGTFQLLQLSPDDGFEKARDVVEVLRVAARSLEPAYPSAYNNVGIAQVVTDAMFLDQIRVDPAMTSFHKCLEMTDDALIVGRLYNNMCATLLLDDNEDDHLLNLASEYSRDAIHTYESATTLSETEKRAGLHRALSLAASCYVRADSAVTAEGLFQTAIETTGVDPLAKISQREAYLSYSDLCRKWDKRSADAEKLQAKSADIERTLSDSWKGKLSIVSGIIFPTLQNLNV